MLGRRQETGSEKKVPMPGSVPNPVKAPKGIAPSLRQTSSGNPVGQLTPGRSKQGEFGLQEYPGPF